MYNDDLYNEDNREELHTGEAANLSDNGREEAHSENSVYSYNSTGYGAAQDSQYRYSQGNMPFNDNISGMAGGAGLKDKDANRKHKKAANSGVKKLAALVGSAALFGAVAGAVMYGVYYTGALVFPKKTGNGSDYTIATVSSNMNDNASYTSYADGAETMNVESVAASAMPAMVALKGKTTVSASSANPFYGLFGSTQSYEAATTGTGIIVGKSDTELLILTNAHVVDGVNDLSCVFADNESVSATVKGAKADKDVAVVAVNLSDIKDSTLSSIAVAELADSEDVAIGQEVVAIGNALGEGQSVTNGIISAKDRSITISGTTFTGLLMTNAAINSGNSGGALLNAKGQVIAINFAKTSTDGVEGMAYSIPVSNVMDIINSLMSKETRTKVSTDKASYLGVGGQDITASIAKTYGYPQGILIKTVDSESPAAEVGLGAYDILVGFDDQTITSMSELKSIMQYYEAGETVTIEYYHPEGSQYIKKTAQVKLAKKK